MAHPPTLTGILSPYGPRRSRVDGRERMHNGVDLAGEEGATPVYAIAPGRVVLASDNGVQGFGGYGRVVVVAHPDLLGDGRDAWALYAHLDSHSVEPGQDVEPGDELGRVGTTNGATSHPGTHFRDGRHVGGRLEALPRGTAPSGPHLHFEIAPAAFPLPTRAPRFDPVATLEALGVPYSSRERGGRPTATPPSSSSSSSSSEEPPPASPASSRASSGMLGPLALALLALFGLSRL